MFVVNRRDTVDPRKLERGIRMWGFGIVEEGTVGCNFEKRLSRPPKTLKFLNFGWLIRGPCCGLIGDNPLVKRMLSGGFRFLGLRGFEKKQ